MAEVTKPIILDETGRAIADAILQVAGAINEESGVIYGFHIDGSESDPASKVQYLKDAVGMTPAKMNYTSGKFEYGSWENAFFMPRPCMLRYDGTVAYYLNPNDYTKKEDGTASDVGSTSFAGNAMMEWGRNGKKIWMKIVPDSNHLGASVYISDHQVDSGYHDWPFHNSKGASVDHFYTPIYNGSLDTNSKLRSLSGQTVMKTKTAENEITYAKNNNPVAANVMWNIEMHCDIDLINMLLVLMGKSTDTQTVFGKGLIDSGSETVNDGFTTGVHNAKGLFYGTNAGAAATYTNAVKVFGMENWWGFQFRRYLGHIMDTGVQKVKNTYGTEDGSTVSDYNLTGSGYKSTGAATLSGNNRGGWIKNEYYTEDGMFPSGALEGSNTTYYADYCWFNNDSVRVPFRGGHSANGAYCGAFSVHLDDTASNAAWNLGAALSCKPLA